MKNLLAKLEAHISGLTLARGATVKYIGADLPRLHGLTGEVLEDRPNGHVLVVFRGPPGTGGNAYQLSAHELIVADDSKQESE